MRRPKVKLDNLLTVITVADRHDLELSAAEIGLTASALRKQIEGIENVLGVALFIRQRGQMVATEDGELFLGEAMQSVEHALLAEEKVIARQALLKHHLIIGHSTYLPPRIIGLVHALTLDDKPLLRIRHVSGLTLQIVRKVVGGTVHAGFGFLPISAPELEVHPLSEEPLVACIPAGHKLAQKTTIYPHDLDGEAIVAVSRESMPELHREIEEHFGDFGIALQVVADAFAGPEALTYVAQRVGICLLAGSSIVSRPGVTMRPLSTRTLMRRTGVFLREDSRSPLLRKLVEKAMQQAKNIRAKA